KKALEVGKPIFGVCLGNQILALAAGGDTYKLKYGHRSQNQPCIQQGTKRCFITTQNHGFAVDMKSLDGQWEEYFINANDGTNEGIRHRTKPFRSVQFHPEARPGPVDAEILFDDFMRMVGP
ncbi:TPA: C26 family cysteine hydrolase domain-containing family, partial [Candidatus Woesearchaeota archaeon]|nr:C26 family cysteine hydrolase domain-containing family [Candidatus Woesearchaeota archaeon]